MEFPEQLYPTPAAGIKYYAVEEEGILYDPIRNHLHVLNATAHQIWKLCDGSRRLSDIISTLSSEYEIPEASLKPQVAGALRQFYQLYYLDVGGLETRCKEGWEIRIVKEIYIQFRDFHVCIHTDREEILEAVQVKFECMISTKPCKEAGRLGVYHSGIGYSVSGTRMMHVQEGSRADALKALKHEVVLHLMLATPELVWLHAGAVTRGSGGVLLVGNWGAGKSTLVTELYGRGWYYLSDDMIPFDPATGKIYSFPLTPAKRVASEEHELDTPVENLLKIDTPLDSKRIWNEGETVVTVLLPSYDAMGNNTPVPVSPGLKMLELFKQCQNAEHLQEGGLERLVHFFEKCPAYRLQYANSQNAASEIEKLM